MCGSLLTVGLWRVFFLGGTPTQREMTCLFANEHITAFGGDDGGYVYDTRTGECLYGYKYVLAERTLHVFCVFSLSVMDGRVGWWWSGSIG